MPEGGRRAEVLHPADVAELCAALRQVGLLAVLVETREALGLAPHPVAPVSAAQREQTPVTVLLPALCTAGCRNRKSSRNEL